MYNFICDLEEELHVMVAHEAHSVSHVIKEFEINKDEFQAHVHFQRGYELHLRGCCKVLEEEPDFIVVDPSTIQMDGCWKMLVHCS